MMCQLCKPVRTCIPIVYSDSKANLLNEKVQDDKTLKIPRQLTDRIGVSVDAVGKMGC